jgi:hypothetical protein
VHNVKYKPKVKPGLFPSDLAQSSHFNPEDKVNMFLWNVEFHLTAWNDITSRWPELSSVSTAKVDMDHSRQLTMGAVLYCMVLFYERTKWFWLTWDTMFYCRFCVCGDKHARQTYTILLLTTTLTNDVQWNMCL